MFKLDLEKVLKPEIELPTFIGSLKKQESSRNTSAAAAESLQSCPTLCDPIDGSPPGCPVPGILQARKLEWVAISFSNAWKWKVKVKSLSHVWPSATPWTTAFQAPPSMGFSRQESCSGVPLPPLLFYWLCQSLCLCRSQQTLQNSSRDGNTRTPYLPLEKCVFRSTSNSLNGTWNNRLIPHWERRKLKLYTVTLLI